MEAIDELASRIRETAAWIEDNWNALKALEFTAHQSGFSVRESNTLPGQKGKLFNLSNEMLDILADMKEQSNIQLELIPVDANENEFTVKNVRTHITRIGIKLKNNNYDFSKDFLMFITDKNVTKRDVKGDENKIKQFLRDIGYKQRGDTKSSRSKVIRALSIKIFSPRKDFTSEGTVYESDEEEKNRSKWS